MDDRQVLSAVTVANYFLSIADKANRKVTNKKLQKLVYYAQAWSLALEDVPMFKEDMEAWIHGPVVPSLYRRYKKYGFGFIEDKGNDSVPALAPHKRLLNDVWRVYGVYDAAYLEVLTHNEDPWIIARNELDANQVSVAVISHDIMRSFYRALHAKVAAENALNE